MPQKNQMLGLMELAADRCGDDILYFFHLLLGAGIGLGILCLFTALNYANNFAPWVNFELPVGSIDVSGALLLSFYFGIVNTFCTLIFAFIIACLADYAVTFVSLCYYYDNESWEAVKFVQRINSAITAFFQRDAENWKAKSAERKTEIRAGISKIKDDPKNWL